MSEIFINYSIDQCLSKAIIIESKKCINNALTVFEKIKRNVIMGKNTGGTHERDSFLEAGF